MHPEMSILLAQLHIDELTQRARQRRPRRTRRRWSRRDLSAVATAPAPIPHLRPPQPPVDDGDDRRAA